MKKTNNSEDTEDILTYRIASQRLKHVYILSDQKQQRKITTEYSL